MSKRSVHQGLSRERRAARRWYGVYDVVRDDTSHLDNLITVTSRTSDIAPVLVLSESDVHTTPHARVVNHDTVEPLQLTTRSENDAAPASLAIILLLSSHRIGRRKARVRLATI